MNPITSVQDIQPILGIGGGATFLVVTLYILRLIMRDSSFSSNSLRTLLEDQRGYYEGRITEMKTFYETRITRIKEENDTQIRMLKKEYETQIIELRQEIAVLRTELAQHNGGH